jgi:NTE family protein
LLKADAVFEGGGVKGIGLVGAVCRFEEEGYTWERLAGTSAGAMIAAMLAAGYTGSELKNMFFEINYKDFKDKGGVQSIPLLGTPINLFINNGVYSGDAIEVWMRKMLRRKGKVKFKDVSENGKSKLKIIAADITKRDLLILPDSLVNYNINPMEFDIAKAVRMSISIPFFFKPVQLRYKNKINYIVDGGIISKFPIWIFDTSKKPRWPTFGFKFIDTKSSYTSKGKKDIISFSLDIIDTMIDKNEEMHIKNKDFVRTVSISSEGIKTADFNLQKERYVELFNSGYNAADKFISNWDFDRYIKDYRS